MPRTPKRIEKVRSTVSKRQIGAVVLEDITDPHNTSAVFRSCDAFGIQDVYLVFNKEPAFNPKKIGLKSSSSANRWLSFHIFDNIEDCYKELANKGFITIATTLDSQANDVYSTDFVENSHIALIFGNEHGGLSPETIANADKKMYIPMQGIVQSLNLSVTAAITLFEMSRQRLYAVDAGHDPFSLPMDEQEDLIENLLKR